MENLLKALTKIDVLSPPKGYITELLGAVCQQLGYSFGSVIELDDNGWGWMFASYNLPENYMVTVNQAAPVLSSPSGEAIKTGEIVVSYNPLGEKRLEPWRHIIKENNIRTIVWVPLLNKGRSFGTCNLYDCRVREINELEWHILQQIGVTISIALASNHYLNKLHDKTRELEAEVTRRKQAEEAIREGERFLNNIFTSIQDGLCVLDDQFNVVRFNHAAERLYAGDRTVLGKKCYRVLRGRESICQGCPALRTLLSGESHHEVMPNKNIDGEISGWSEIYSFPLIESSTGQIKGVTLYVRDITEKRNMEQEMSRFERLNLIGEMAAGIGHEIRNPMTTVRGFLQLLGGKKECLKFRDYYDLMIEELDRANSIISEFLSLAKNRMTEFSLQNLNGIVNSLHPLIDADAMNMDKYVELQLEDVPDLWLDEKEIRQLILNLVRNGLEAMEGEEALTIRTFTAEDEVILAVTDRGRGIEPGVLEKIGTPFFSTKDNGTGLGLAVCYSIAARHNASIKIQTGSGGTTFTVHFRQGEK